MQLLLTARHFDLTPALRQLVNRRLAKLERVLNDSLVSVQVVLTLKKFHHVADVTVHARGDHVLHGMGDATGWSPALAVAVDKLLHQASTLKGKWAERKRRAPRTRTVSKAVPPPPPQEPEAPQPTVRRQRYAVKPMTVEDAAVRVRRERETFLVFRNETTDAINIVYRRQDGQVGLIDPDE